MLSVFAYFPLLCLFHIVSIILGVGNVWTSRHGWIVALISLSQYSHWQRMTEVAVLHHLDDHLFSIIVL